MNNEISLIPNPLSPEKRKTVVKKRILIIDDEDDIREVTQTGLELTTNWEVLTANSYFKGVAVAAVDQPDAILLNTKLSESAVSNILQNLTAHPATQDIPVILMTDRVRLADKSHFTQLGVAGVMAKPFDSVNLARQIAGFLSWSI